MSDTKHSDANMIAGRFRMDSRVGEGAMGQVYRCHDMKLDKTVAIKLLQPDASNMSVSRFHVEAKALANANHTNILRVFDFGQAEDGRLYLVMEFIEGVSLASYIKEHEFMPIEDALPIFSQICRGLQYAHSHLILHRDIKPNNVMLVKAEDGSFTVKLVDFGLAKLTDRNQYLTKTGTALGTPPYMSPETVKGIDQDERSDIYSLGCLMYEVLTGHLPFLGPTRRDTMFEHVDSPIPALSDMSELPFPLELEDLVRKCMEKDPDFRYQSAKALLQAIERTYENSIAFGADTSSDSVQQEAEQRAHGIKYSGKFPRAKSLWKQLEPYLVASSTLLLLTCVLISTLKLTVGNPDTSTLKKTNSHREPKNTASLESNEEVAKGLEEFASESLAPQASEGYDHTLRQPFCQISGDVTEQQLQDAAKKFSRMKIFRFYRAPLPGAGLSYFVNLPLYELSIEQSPMPTSDFEKIAKLKTLKRLRLLNSSPITSQAVENLRHLNGLRLLEIRCLGEHDDHFRTISQLKHLEHLLLYQYKIGPNSILALQHSPSLTYLSLQQCETAPNTFAELKNLKKLKKLELVNMPISVDDIKQITPLPLEVLQIASDKVSDYSLRKLAEMNHLEELDLAGASANESLVAFLQSKHPSLKIRVDNMP